MPDTEIDDDDTTPSMPVNATLIVLDVWGGERSQTHVARALLPVEHAMLQARIELAAGYLVNMRPELAWGPGCDFDLRALNGAN